MSTPLQYSSPFFTHWKNTISDTVECCFRQCRRLVRPFRYWNFLSLLKAANVALCLQGFVVFFLSNRLLKNETTSTSSSSPAEAAASASATSLVVFFRKIPWLRQLPPRNWSEASRQLSWFVYCVMGGGFPFYAVRHPTPSASGVFRRYIHPSFYWGFLGVYKIVWSTYQAVRVAAYLTNPRSFLNVEKVWGTQAILSCIQRERILQLQNLRYQHQLNSILTELRDPLNQRDVKAVKIENRWVATGPLGAAIQDILDEARDLVLLRPYQVVNFFHRLGTSFPALTEVSIAMSLSLPLQALKQLLESAPRLQYLRLDGVALSAHDLEPDLLAFGRSLHGLVGHLRDSSASLSSSSHSSSGGSATGNGNHEDNNHRRCLALKTLKLENCRLENDEPDPQLRQRYSMDLLLAPAIFAALMPPTLLHLQHLTLWVKCQRISALELAVCLGDNTSLKSLDLHLIRDKSLDVEEDGDDEEEEVDDVDIDLNDGGDNENNNVNNNVIMETNLLRNQEEDPAEWIVLPLAQVLQQRNNTLTELSLQLPTGLDRKEYSHKALRRMMELNETIQSLHLLRVDTQQRIRIPEVEFYLHLNQLGRKEFRLECAAGSGTSSSSDFRQTATFRRWIECLIQQRRNTAVVHYFLSLNPSLLLQVRKGQPR